MFDKKSEYALNKYDQDSIIYISVSGRIRLTLMQTTTRQKRKAGASTIIGWLWMITWM